MFKVLYLPTAKNGKGRPRQVQSATLRFIMDIMSKFWHAVRLVFLERMAYRANLFLEVIGGILASVIVVVLWAAIYKGAGTDTIGDYSLPEMVTYLLGAGLINSFILTTAENPEASQAIQEGDLSGLLIRPMSPHLFWLARDVGNKGFFLLLGLAGYSVVLVFFRDFLLPPPGTPSGAPPFLQEFQATREGRGSRDGLRLDPFLYCRPLEPEIPTDLEIWHFLECSAVVNPLSRNTEVFSGPLHIENLVLHGLAGRQVGT